MPAPALAGCGSAPSKGTLQAVRAGNWLHAHLHSAPAELAQVEADVNAQILGNRPVSTKLMTPDAAIEAGAEDVATNDDGSIEVLTAPNDFSLVKDALEKAGFKPEFGEVTMKAENETEFDGDDAIKMQKLLDALDSLDDVQDVYTTALIDE